MEELKKRKSTEVEALKGQDEALKLKMYKKAKIGVTKPFIRYNPRNIMRRFAYAI